MIGRDTSPSRRLRFVLYLAFYLGAAFPLLWLGIKMSTWNDLRLGSLPPRLYPLTAANIFCIAGPVVGLLLVCLKRSWKWGGIILAAIWLLVIALVIQHGVIHGA